ncbi:MAG: hypothetical protein HZA12_03130 [Nitrospirae bacterium]|nr:hypothetical protein [Nitrospirota bacterium]
MLTYIRRDLQGDGIRLTSHVSRLKPAIKTGATFLFLLFTIMAGCAGKEILSEDAVRIGKSVDFVNELKGLYEQRDERLISMFSKEYLEEGDIKRVIMQDTARFNDISLSLFIDRIEVEKEKVNISAHWNGTWKDVEKTYREGGSAVILVLYGDSIHIIGVKGDSPFGISGRLK